MELDEKEEKLFENFKKGFEIIKKYGFKTNKEEIEVNFKFNKQDITVIIPEGFTILDCELDTLKKWIQITKIVDIMYSKDEESNLIKKINEFLNNY